MVLQKHTTCADNINDSDIHMFWLCKIKININQGDLEQPMQRGI